MRKAERDELAKILKARARVAKSTVDQRAAVLLADAEQQLAARYKINAPLWADLTIAAEQAVETADAELAKRCRALGIPEEFRPGLHFSWYGRGENAEKNRRAELRKVAQTRIDAMAQAARVAIETRTLDGLTQLAAGALESAEAQAFLASMPTIEALMPALDVSSLGPLALPRTGEDGLRLVDGSA
jgi:hypothetical protein